MKEWYTMADSNIHTELCDASVAGDDNRVRELLGAGADPDKYRNRHGWTALYMAASRGRDSTVSILIQHGADLNIQNKYGKTALYRAAEKHYDSIVSILILHEADLNRLPAGADGAVLHRLSAARLE